MQPVMQRGWALHAYLALLHVAVAVDATQIRQSASYQKGTLLKPDSPNVEYRSSGWSTASFLGGIAVGVVITTIGVAIVSGKLGLGHATKPRESTPEDSPDSVDPALAGLSTSRSDSSFGTCAGPKSLTEDQESLHLFVPRLTWLIAMLVIQSASSIILEGFDHLVKEHTVIFYFMTMLVGIGGNAGGQSAVLTVRRLAVGQEVKIFEQLAVGMLLSLAIGPLAFVRAIIQVGRHEIRECLCIGIASMVICIVATTLGTAIPKVLWLLKSDPAHASSTIQVLMDIVGIVIVCGLGVGLVSHVQG